jgi:hypothetical protein
MFDIVTLEELQMNPFKNYNRLQNPGWLDDIYDIFTGIFGSKIDPGHWEGSLFVPGDLNSRIAISKQKISSSGLSQYAVESEWMPILYTPAGWQAAIDNYIGNILNGRAKGTVPLYKEKTTAGGVGQMDLTSLLIVGAGLGLLAYYSKKKRK